MFTLGRSPSTISSKVGGSEARFSPSTADVWTRTALWDIWRPKSRRTSGSTNASDIAWLDRRRSSACLAGSCAANRAQPAHPERSSQLRGARNRPKTFLTSVIFGDYRTMITRFSLAWPDFPCEATDPNERMVIARRDAAEASLRFSSRVTMPGPACGETQVPTTPEPGTCFRVVAFTPAHTVGRGCACAGEVVGDTIARALAARSRGPAVRLRLRGGCAAGYDPGCAQDAAGPRKGRSPPAVEVVRVVGVSFRPEIADSGRW